MRLRQFFGFCLGLIGTWLMWQVGVGLAHFIHMTVSIDFPEAFGQPEIMARVLSALGAFLAGLAALTERKGGAWLAGISTFMFSCVTLGLIHGRHDISVWRDDYIYLSIMTVLFLALVVLRREEEEETEESYGLAKAE